MNTTKILILTANPDDQEFLHVDKEYRAIEKALRLADHGRAFDVRPFPNLRYNDLQELLLYHRPQIVHFSGHGLETGEIILVNEKGGGHNVSPVALGRFFANHSDYVDCVVLNACFTEQQAKAIRQHIRFVVGMSSAIGDDDAIEFAHAFYHALGSRADLQRAFESGCAQIDLANLPGVEEPQLLCDPDEQPDKFNFFRNGSNIDGHNMHQASQKLRMAIRLIARRRMEAQHWKQLHEEFQDVNLKLIIISDMISLDHLDQSIEVLELNWRMDCSMLVETVVGIDYIPDGSVRTAFLSDSSGANWLSILLDHTNQLNDIVDQCVSTVILRDHMHNVTANLKNLRHASGHALKYVDRQLKKTLHELDDEIENLRDNFDIVPYVYVNQTDHNRD